MAENIPFTMHPPKNGKFIDWDFTLMILGDANPRFCLLWRHRWVYVFVTIIWCGIMDG
jgi:hypothetical protein